MLLFLILSCSVMGQDNETVSIVVVYPKPGQIVTAVDSTFILGHIVNYKKSITLIINDAEVKVHKDGGFLAFLPVIPGAFEFNLNAYENDNLKSQETIPVKIPKPLAAIDESDLQISGDYRAPRGNLVLQSGDLLEIMFRGTPGLQAWCSIDSVADSIPMSETEPKNQPYWGESVFGAGAVPDSVKVRGIYAGMMQVKDFHHIQNKKIKYHLAPPDQFKIVCNILNNMGSEKVFDWLSFLRSDSVVTSESSYEISLNPPDFPYTVRFTDSVQTIRHGPRKGYFGIFQPQGVEALVVGAEDGWLRCKMSETQYSWVNEESVEKLAPGIFPQRSTIVSLRAYSTDTTLLIEIPLSRKHAFQVIENSNRSLKLRLFGVLSDTDWIRYDFSDPLINIATWFQPEEELYELNLDLTQDIWGYDTYYNGNTFYLQLNKPPRNVETLRGKRIVIDPGHSSDPGSIGPTGLTEAEANLNISLILAHELKRKGAEVIMTRDDASNVPLYDRPIIAKTHEADLFVSIHNNALPDGVNPYINNGVSAFYYHPHSMLLAKKIQTEMIRATALPDHGLFYGNLAVNRPTQYPAVLIECAFMIIPEQEAKLKTERFQHQIAGAITQGIINFLKEYDRHGRR